MCSCVAPVAANAPTLSAVRSDVSYAAPDSGYSWTETDTPEITGTSHSHNTRAPGSVLPPPRPPCSGGVVHPRDQRCMTQHASASDAGHMVSLGCCHAICGPDHPMCWGGGTHTQIVLIIVHVGVMSL